MRELSEHPAFDLKVAVTGSHLRREYGFTYREIEADGFSIDARVPAPFDTASPRSVAEAVGAWTRGFAGAFERLAPDVVLAMGDRYELLSVASAATLLAIPLAHVSGGEITEGAVDDQIRHALTKLSHLHFVSNRVYAQRVLQMGEEAWRVCVSGEPGLDNVRQIPLLSRAELEREIGLDLGRPTAVVSFHPVTRELDQLDAQIADLSGALEDAGLQCVLSYPNADPGSARIIAAWKRFAARHEGARLFRNLGQRRYLSLLEHAHLIVGNSSSALVEAPAFNLPAVNVGTRQKGRLEARNVISVPHGRSRIRAAIRAALAYDRRGRCANPYGDGRSSPRVRRFLERVFRGRTRRVILDKRFVDRPAAGGPT
jgi:GDP/UDP-N,N'-diacetylbacillosamine 2-epimerase (hydrolysing)